VSRAKRKTREDDTRKIKFTDFLRPQKSLGVSITATYLENTSHGNIRLIQIMLTGSGMYSYQCDFKRYRCRRQPTCSNGTDPQTPCKLFRLSSGQQLPPPRRPNSFDTPSPPRCLATMTKQVSDWWRPWQWAESLVMNCGKGLWVIVSRFVPDLIWIGLYQLVRRLFNSPESMISVIRSVVLNKQRARQQTAKISISQVRSKRATVFGIRIRQKKNRLK